MCKIAALKFYKGNGMSSELFEITSRNKYRCSSPRDFSYAESIKGEDNKKMVLVDIRYTIKDKIIDL
jgi:hypothetical protein